MELGNLLRRFEAECLTIQVEEEKTLLRSREGPIGKELVEELRPSLTEYRELLIRLYRKTPDAPGWRNELAKADVDTREGWVLLSQGHELCGFDQRCAEWLAWEELHG